MFEAGSDFVTLRSFGGMVADECDEMNMFGTYCS